MRTTHKLLATLSLCAVATAALAQDINPAVSARQSHMKLNAHNLYYLIGVTRGRSDYDATLAQAAADNLVHLAMLDQSRYWPKGTSSDELAETHALPALWQNFPDVMEKVAAVREKAAALQAVAGTGMEAMGAAAGELNNACNACHKAYRMSQN
jgi:cytochrome c556